MSDLFDSKTAAIVPVEGHHMVTAKPEDWANKPLSSAGLSWAKAQLAKRFDRNWEDR